LHSLHEFSTWVCTDERTATESSSGYSRKEFVSMFSWVLQEKQVLSFFVVMLVWQVRP
jgi:hypothetical protein